MTEKPKHDYLPSAFRAASPNDSWKIIWGCQEFDGNDGFYIENHAANFTMKSMGVRFFERAPNGSGPYGFDVYELTNDAGKVVRAGVCELSNGVWASAIWDPEG